jgi:hypothetical protein
VRQSKQRFAHEETQNWQGDVVKEKDASEKYHAVQHEAL